MSLLTLPIEIMLIITEKYLYAIMDSYVDKPVAHCQAIGELQDLSSFEDLA